MPIPAGGSAVIEDRVALAGQVGVADHVLIKGGVKVDAQGGVPTRKALSDAGQVFRSTPGRPLRNVLKELAALARLAKR